MNSVLFLLKSSEEAGTGKVRKGGVLCCLWKKQDLYLGPAPACSTVQKVPAVPASPSESRMGRRRHLAAGQEKNTFGEISALRRQRQENYKFQATLGCRRRHRLKIQGKPGASGSHL
jgi:hypothetical protein